MPDSQSTPEPMVLHPQDFDPPIKRKEPLIPGYWTIDELAAELEALPDMRDLRLRFSKENIEL